MTAKISKTNVSANKKIFTEKLVTTRRSWSPPKVQKPEKPAKPVRRSSQYPQISR